MFQQLLTGLTKGRKEVAVAERGSDGGAQEGGGVWLAVALALLFLLASPLRLPRRRKNKATSSSQQVFKRKGVLVSSYSSNPDCLAYE